MLSEKVPLNGTVVSTNTDRVERPVTRHTHSHTLSRVKLKHAGVIEIKIEDHVSV